MNPPCLYKYLDFNEGSLKAISDATLKFTLPRDFNDPFDCLATYSVDFVSQRIKKQRDYLVSASGGKKLSPANRLIAGRRARQRAKVNIQNGGIFSPLRAGDIGVLSLSSNKDNLLMWSHYCKHHTGFVLKFEPEWYGLPATLKDPEVTFKSLVALEVNYSNERPILNGQECAGQKLDKLLLTKSIDWEYESEFRVIDNVRKAGIHPYKRELLKGVYAGANMNLKGLQTLQEIVATVNSKYGLNIKVFQMRLQETSFSLVEHEISR